MYKIIGADQKEYGPVSADQLRQWLTEGRVNAQTKVQPEGGTGWRSISELPEFASAFPSATPAPAPTMAPGGSVFGQSTIAARVTNTLAIWSMVLGIGSLLFICCGQIILGPISIAMGAAALSQIRGDSNQTGSGFAITGIILGSLALLLCILAFVFMSHSPQMLQQWQDQLKHMQQQQ